MIRSRDDALSFLFSRIDYERASAVPYGRKEFKLSRMRRLLRRLGDPHLRLPVVHVAGTKGKGSTAAMIAAALGEAGLKAGLYTSPHIDTVEERWRVNGECCSEDELLALVEAVRPHVEEWDRSPNAAVAPPTFFELSTALAFLHFERRAVDLAVMEVGLGGRLDSTNVCRPRLAVITSISLDHTRQLGSTNAAIAREKAGIIKPDVPVISGIRDDDAHAEVLAACRRLNCSLQRLGADFGVRYTSPRGAERADVYGRADICFFDESEDTWRGCEIGMLGAHQADNAAVAAAALRELRRQNWEISESAVRRGLKLARCPARIEILQRRPTVIVDAAHNVASAQALCRTLDDSFKAARRMLVFGGTREKDVRGMLAELLPGFQQCIFTTYRDNPRGVPAEELCEMARGIAPATDVESALPEQAWEIARRRLRPDDLLCICGSFYLAAELRRRIAADPDLRRASLQA